MRRLGLYFPTSVLLCLSLGSCSILAIPFKVMRSVAWAGKKSYDAASTPFKKSEEEKIEEKAKEIAARQKKEEEEKRKNSNPPQLPDQPTLPQDTPVPQDMQLPQEPLPGTEPPLPE